MKTFTFDYNNNRKEDCYYTINVTIEKIDDGSYYDIKYHYVFNNGSFETPPKIKLYKTLTHPFYLGGALTQYTFSNERENIDGVIVYVNEITTKMIDMLFMSDKQLELYCGKTNFQKYRQKIMIALCYFVRG
tara:strand:+ start:175 stop:570 length:396 start_codon:yes stop_codon:yes gene_type:complete